VWTPRELWNTEGEEGTRAKEHLMFEIRTILHPTDFSDRSEGAFHLACSLARHHGARLIVLHVIPPPICHGEVVARQQPDGYREQMWDWLSRLQPPDPGVDIDHRLTDGDPAAEILRVAQDDCCDLIVMGTHGRTGLGRLLMGSVAEQVVRKASCPVLTVKAPLPEKCPDGEPAEVTADRAAGAAQG
jgi:nucleotide-binding universal stress UspA family protein